MGVGVGVGDINKCGIFLLKSLIVKTIYVMYHVFHASKVSESFQTSELSFFLALGLGLCAY